MIGAWHQLLHPGAWREQRCLAPLFTTRFSTPSSRRRPAGWCRSRSGTRRRPGRPPRRRRRRAGPAARTACARASRLEDLGRVGLVRRAGQDLARRDRVDDDAARPEVDRQLAREVDNAALGGAVGDVAGGPIMPCWEEMLMMRPRASATAPGRASAARPACSRGRRRAGRPP